MIAVRRNDQLLDRLTFLVGADSFFQHVVVGDSIEDESVSFASGSRGYRHNTSSKSERARRFQQ